MISRKNIITIVVFIVLVTLAYIAMSVSKSKVGQVNNTVNTEVDQLLDQESQLDDQASQTELLNNELKKDNKKMTEIKEFSFETLKEGTGAVAEKGKTVTVDYKGTFIDEKVFDQGTFPFVLGVGQVVQGFDKGVLGMKVGETRKIYIPSEMGYGVNGAGATIPPNSDLIFEVTLKSIQ